MTTKKATTVKIKTGVVRASYVRIFEPTLNTLNKKQEYTMMLLIPKHDTKTIDAINSAVKTACKSLFGSDDLKSIGIPRHPLRDPLEEDKKKNDPTYKDVLYLNVKDHTRPGVAEIVDGKLMQIDNPAEFKSGDYCKVSLAIKAFDKTVNKGVNVYIQNVLKTGDGESLAGKVSVKDDFADECQNAGESTFMDDVPQ